MYSGMRSVVIVTVGMTVGARDGDMNMMVMVKT